MSDETDEYTESRIQEIMAKGHTREYAEKTLASSRVAVANLNPSKPIGTGLLSPDEYLNKIRREKAQQIHNKKVVEESETEPIDEIAEQKKRILDKIEQQLDVENEFANLINIPEWRGILTQYIFALRFCAEGKADYFLQSVRADPKNNLLHFKIDYYKNHLKVEPMQIYHSVVQDEDEGEEK